MDVASIRQMLETQYRPFIREDQYIEAFDQAMKVFDQINPDMKGGNDPFYYFLHQLILHLVERIGNLERELNSFKNQQEVTANTQQLP